MRFSSVCKGFRFARSWSANTIYVTQNADHQERVDSRRKGQTGGSVREDFERVEPKPLKVEEMEKFFEGGGG